MSGVGVGPTVYLDGEMAPKRIAEEVMERRAAAESSEARLRAGQMMHADLEADAPTARQ